jgi:hypothetical protein
MGRKSKSCSLRFPLRFAEGPRPYFAAWRPAVFAHGTVVRFLSATARSQPPVGAVGTLSRVKPGSDPLGEEIMCFLPLVPVFLKPEGFRCMEVRRKGVASTSGLALSVLYCNELKTGGRVV